MATLSKIKVLSSFTWKMWLSLVIVILMINELCIWIASHILGIQFFHFPHSLINEYQIIQYGLIWALVFAFVLVLSLAYGIYAIFTGKRSGQIVLGLPVTFIVGAILGNIILSLIEHVDLTLSPFVFFHYQLGELGDYSGSMMQPVYYYYAAFLLVSGVYYASIIRYWVNKPNVHGNARFANVVDLIKYNMLKKQVESLFLAMWLGKEVYANGYEHVLILAPSGSGKSSTYGVINLIEWQGSSVSNDLSGELYNKTSRYLRNTKKSAVFKFDPLNRLFKTNRWNIYHDVCKLDEAQRYGELSRIAALIIPENKGGNDSSWTYAARNGIECVSAYLISTTQYCTLGDVAEICCRGDFDEWLQKEIDNPKTDAQFKVRANAYLSVKAQETRSGVKFNMDAHLGLYLNPIIRAATAYSDFNLSDLRRIKMDVFFTVPQGQMKYISPLVTMFWEELTHQMTLNEPKEDEPYAVFCNIDETGNMGRVNNLRTGASYLRKYKLRITFYFQYKDQAGDLYSDREMKAFLNTKNKLLFTPSDDDDVEYISKMSGRITKKYKTKSRQGSWGQVNVSEHMEKGNLLEFNDVKYMPDNRLLIQVDGRYMIKATKRFYFKDRKYKFLNNCEVDGNKDKLLPTQKPILPKVPEKVVVDNPEDDLRKQAKEQREKQKNNENIAVIDNLIDNKQPEKEKEGW